MSASFVFAAGELVLDGFDAGQDVGFSQQGAIIDGNLTEAYQFELASGSWNGNSSLPGIDVESVNGGTNNLLEVATNLFGGADQSRLTIDGNTGTPLNIDLEQLSTLITLGELKVSNLSAVDSDFQLNVAGDIALSSIEVIDSDPSDNTTTSANLEVVAQGQIRIDGSLQNQMEHIAASISIGASGINSDVVVDSLIQTATGSISIEAFDSILIDSGGELRSLGSGNISLAAGEGTGGDSGDEIRMEDGSSAFANGGIIELDSENGGDIWLSTLRSERSGLAISVHSGENIFDNTAAELANLTAVNGSLNLQASDDVGDLSATTNFFNPSMLENIETRSAFVDIEAGGNVAIESVNVANVVFAVDAETVFLSSDGDIAFQNRNSPLNQLSIRSDGSIVLPDELTVSQDLAVVAQNQIVASDGSIDVAGDRLLFQSGSDAVLSTRFGFLDVTTHGELDIENQGDTSLLDLDGNLIAVQNLSSTGDIRLSTTGTLLIENAVLQGNLGQSTTSGGITLNGFLGVDNQSLIIGHEGDIRLIGDAEIVFGSQAVASSVSGNIELVSGNEIDLLDGSTIIAGRGQIVIDDIVAPNLGLGTGTDGGSIRLSADGNISVSSLQTTNTTNAAISVASYSGSISDGGDFDLDIVALHPNATVLLAAAGGIGENNAIETEVSSLVAASTRQGSIEIGESSDIRLIELKTADGRIAVVAAGDIEAVSVQTNETEIIEDDFDDIVLTAESGATWTGFLSSADDIVLQARLGSITDHVNGSTSALGSASFTAFDTIELGNDSDRRIRIDGHSSFAANTVRVGQDGEIAGNPNASNVQFGSVQIVGDEAVLTEDDATVFAGNSQVTDRMFISSAVSIRNQTDAIVEAEGLTQLHAAEFVFLGNQVGDRIRLNEVGVVTVEAHLELDSGIQLLGETPVQLPTAFGSDASLGTSVDQTYYIDAAGDTIQSTGELRARRLAVDADGRVELATISAFNESLALSARDAAAVADPGLNSQLNAIKGIENSEVEANRPHSIALQHLGTANISEIRSPTGTGTVSGLNSFSGSIFVSATSVINIQQNITAISTTADPQVTLYVEDGTVENPNINFNSTEIRVMGTQNLGVVNQNQTSANFFLMDDVVFEGTTKILVPNPNGTVDQDIQLEYGNAGEEGYRVGVVWDSANLPDSPIETLNNWVANVNDPTEFFIDSIYQNNSTTILQLGGNEGGSEVISKVNAFSKDAIVNHQKDPDVFATITVRNDQNINLFVGDLSTADNTLNETMQVLRAELDAPKKFAIQLPPISEINPIEFRTSIDAPITTTTPENVVTETFDREVRPFETGELKWVRVDIPIEEMEDVGEDIRIKDPTRDYKKSVDADEFPVDGTIGDNEFEKIILQIEKEPEAEAGYWYKVFKDYKNRDDELFFYYLKTGEDPRLDLGPESDFRPSVPDAEQPKSQPQPRNNDQPAVEAVDESAEEPSKFQPDTSSVFESKIAPDPDTRLTDTPTNVPGVDQDRLQQAFDSDGNANHGSLSGALMAAWVGARLQRKVSQIQPAGNDEASIKIPADSLSFSRMDRLKRKLAKCFHQEG